MSLSITPTTTFDPSKATTHEEYIEGMMQEYKRREVMMHSIVANGGGIDRYLDKQLHPNREFWCKCRVITGIALVALLLIASVTLILVARLNPFLIPPGLKV
jgi:hypothetical protein